MTFDEEKLKLHLEHRLEMHRIVLDKFLFGLVFIGLGWLGSHALEGYKARETARQFFLEQRYNAIKETRSTFSGVTQAFFQMTNDVCKGKNPTNEQRDNVRTEIKKFTLSLNDSSVLFDKDYNQASSSVVNVFWGMNAQNYVFTWEHREFANAISLYFTNINISALESSHKFGEMQVKGAFQPQYREPGTLDAMGVETYSREAYDSFAKDSQ